MAIKIAWLSNKMRSRPSASNGAADSTAARQNRRKRVAGYIKKIYLSIGLICATITFGIAGFMFIEDYSLNEAFYMTIITLSTVGYTEVRPLTEDGRIFASLLIITNIGMFAYAMSLLSSFFVEGDLKNILQSIRMQKKIEELNKHVIVCGYGRYGTEVCEHFRQHNIDFIVIEAKPEVVKQLKEKGDILYLSGDATEDSILLEAGVERAVSLISTLPDDAENAYVVLTARQLNKRLRIISRAERGKSERTLKLAGADEVITPERIGGFYMATLVGQPDVVEFFRVMTDPEEGANINFEELNFNCDEMPEEFAHKTIRELSIRSETGANVIGVKMPDGSYVINPPADMKLEPHMRLIVLGNEEQIESFRQFWLRYVNDGVQLIDFDTNKKMG